MHLRHFTSLLTAGALALTSLVALPSATHAQESTPTTPTPEIAPVSAAMPLSSNPKIKAWQDLRFGLFIHWGVYSEYAGFVNGKQQRIGYPEQIKAWEKISDTDYLATASKMTIPEFNPTQWCKDAKDAGMKYLLVTSKHHDGFTMFKSDTTTFDFYDAAPGQRDPMKELADACKAMDMKLGFYFSIIDWTKQEAEPNRNLNPLNEEMMTLIRAQLSELLSGRYGQVPEVWFDMGAPTPEQSQRMANWVREFSPTTVVNSRVWNDKGDFEVGHDNAVTTHMTLNPWQSIRSTFPRCWGYCRWPREEATRNDPKGVERQTKHEVENLFGTIANGGQYLLNVGPKGSGAFDPFEREILKGIGAWNTRHPHAIHGAVPTYYPAEGWGFPVINGNAIYLGVRNWTDGGEIRLRGAGSNVTGVTIDDATNPGRTVAYRVEENKDLVITLPTGAPENILPMLKVATNGEPTYVPAVSAVVEEGKTKTVAADDMLVIDSPKEASSAAQYVTYVSNPTNKEQNLTVGGLSSYPGTTPLAITINGTTVNTTVAALADGVTGFTLAPNSTARVIIERANKAYYADPIGAQSLTEMWFAIKDTNAAPVVIHHEFVSTDETPLPEELANKAPADRTAQAAAPKVTPSAVTETLVTIGEHNWRFQGWDATTKPVEGNKVTFTGRWKAGPLQYPVSYTYVNGNPDHAMPDAIRVFVPRGGDFDKGSTVTPAAPQPNYFRDRAEGKTWRFVKWEPAVIENLTGPATFTGTWEYTRDQDVTAQYAFVAKDGSELPDAVKALLPRSTEHKAPVSRIMPSFPESTIVQVEGGEWEFDGYDLAFVNWPQGPTHTFTGTWHWQKTRHNLSFTFESADPDRQLPRAITRMKPRDMRATEGEPAELPKLTRTTVAQEGGLWSFSGWEPAEVPSVSGPMEIKGKWVFTPGEVSQTVYEYVSGDSTKELPFDLAFYTPTPEPYLVGSTVKPRELKITVVDTFSDGKWSFVGWEPEVIENAPQEAKFVGKWVPGEINPKPQPHNVSYEFTAAAGELPDAVKQLLPAATTGEHDSVVNPVDPEHKVVESIEGTWSFDGWDKTEATLTEDVVFRGMWIYKARTFVPKYNFGDLPDVIVALHDTSAPVVIRDNMVCAPAPAKASAETATHKWTFNGWEKECYTLEEVLKLASVEGVTPSGPAGGALFFADSGKAGVVFNLSFVPQWTKEAKPADKPTTPAQPPAPNGGTTTPEGKGSPSTTIVNPKAPHGKVVTPGKGSPAPQAKRPAMASTGASDLLALSALTMTAALTGVAMRRRRRNQ